MNFWGTQTFYPQQWMFIDLSCTFWSVTSPLMTVGWSNSIGHVINQWDCLLMMSFSESFSVGLGMRFRLPHSSDVETSFFFFLSPRFSFCVWVFIHIWLFVTPWTATFQALLSMGFPRQEYWNGLPFPSPGDLPNQGTEHASPASPTWTGRFFIIEPLGKPI